ncbi:MAG: TIGR02679 family protein [Candidatus Nanopelagicales bacterium]
MLPEWLADSELRPAWERIRTRFEQAGLHASGLVTVPVTSRAERHALGALLGRTVIRDRVRIGLAALDARLRERSGVGGLAAVLAAYFGSPLQDRPAARIEQQEAREGPLALAADLVQAPWVLEWIAGLRATGALLKNPDPEQTVRQAAAVLNELGGWGRELATVSRVELGAQLLGDAHALDHDRPLHQIVLRGLAAAAGTPLPVGARQRSALWARFGVEPDLLSRTCLVWGLRFADPGPVGQRLSLAAEAGDPVHLTEWDLRRIGSFSVEPGLALLICENPRVVEALAEAALPGWAAVCTAGEPNLVADKLLTNLARSGTCLRYHGDFDWPGVAIANRAIQRYGVQSWKMTAADYLAAVRDEGPELRGPAVEPTWDAELGAAMRSRRRGVHEESALADLLNSLAAM